MYVTFDLVATWKLDESLECEAPHPGLISGRKKGSDKLCANPHDVHAKNLASFAVAVRAARGGSCSCSGRAPRQSARRTHALRGCHLRGCWVQSRSRETAWERVVRVPRRAPALRAFGASDRANSDASLLFSLLQQSSPTRTLHVRVVHWECRAHYICILYCSVHVSLY